jgi:hypothetical protein
MTADSTAAPGVEQKPLHRSDSNNSKSLSYQFRARRDVRLRQLISEVAREKNAPISIIDVGGRVPYWHRVGLDFLRECRATVTVTNIVEEELEDFEKRDGLFKTAVLDACDMGHVPDHAFDLVHSNSVIEHVGNWSRMRAFAGEVVRVSRRYYVQTPNFWFPIDPHHAKAPFIHWLPRHLAARWMTHFAVSWGGKLASLDAAYDHLDYTNMLDERQFRSLFPGAEIHHERVLGLVKSFVAIG